MEQLVSDIIYNNSTLHKVFANQIKDLQFIPTHKQNFIQINIKYEIKLKRYLTQTQSSNLPTPLFLKKYNFYYNFLLS